MIECGEHIFGKLNIMSEKTKIYDTMSNRENAIYRSNLLIFDSALK